MPNSRTKLSAGFRPVAKFLVAAILMLTAPIARSDAFELKSPDIAEGQKFSEKFTFNGMGCKGQNVSPALNWTVPPQGTQSLALMVHDPDAPTGGAGIWHWVIVNIPPTARSIEQGAGDADGAKLPTGSRQIMNDYAGMTGNPGWGGPCPPPGQKAHNYVFTLYALKVDKLEFKPAATASQYGFFINRNVLGKAQLTVTYGRD